MTQIGNRCHGHMYFNFGVVVGVGCHHDEKDGGTLGVPHIVEASLMGDVQNVIDHCWKIDRAHFVPAEVPEFGVSVWVECGVVAGGGGSSNVAKPDVVTFIS